MVIYEKKYDVIDLETGRLDPLIFTDEEVYREELDKIFGRAWVMIGHDTLVPNRNDFFHTYIGEDPVILTRDANGKLHAFLNVCRHRGARVVRGDIGNAPNFMCAYHGWTYSNQGDLEFVPGEDEAYYRDIDKEELRLVEAKVETYAGIVFATWDKGAPTLEAFLGDARWYLDMTFNRLDGGTEAFGPIKWIEPVNWKTAVDNCSDNYHVPTTHLSAILVGTQMQGLPRLTHQKQFESENKHIFINGHSITVRPLEKPDQARQIHGVTEENRHLFEDFYRSTFAEAEKRLGSFRAGGLQLGNHSIFPNVVLGFRLAHPRGPLETEFWHFALVEKDLPEDLKSSLKRASGNYNGVTGLFEQDDMDNWRGVTRGSRGSLARAYGQRLSMGVGHEGRNPDLPGIVSERYVSENNQRHFYRRWEEFMNADSWTDIPLEPITANFEGAATIKGTE